MIQRFEVFTSAISSIYREIQKIERAEMERYGLKGAYTQYLLAIDYRPEGMTAAKLCEICDKNKAAVSRILSEMEHSGLIQRSTNPYKSLLTLTAKGREAVEYVKGQLGCEVYAVNTGKNPYAPYQLVTKLP
jgi:DNA-binding MarR family transcriptional regulator